MFALMEKYANSLEAIVTERTSLLQEERRRADSLLYQMMPKFVIIIMCRMLIWFGYRFQFSFSECG